MSADLKTGDTHVLFLLGGVSMKGGAEISMLTVARGLKAKGYRVSLVIYGTYSNLVDRAGQGIEIIRIDKARTATAALPLYHIIRQMRPSVLITAMTHTNVIGILAAAAACTGTRVIVTEHGQTAFDPRFLKPLEGLLLPKITGLLYAFTGEVVAVSKGLAKLIEGIIPWKRKRPVRVIYNPVVSATPIQPSPPPHPWFNDGKGPVIMSVGRFEKEKNFSLLVRAFAAIPKEQAIRLIILGEGSQLHEIQALAESLGVKDRILFPGFVPNVSDWLQHGSVFVCSSMVEAFGNAIVEAMACGLTVVSVDCPHGPAEILEQGRYGKLVPFDDVPALAAAISDAVEHPMDKDAIRSRAATFNETRCFDAYDQLIRGLCNAA